MELEFKRDFKECRERWDRFWANENTRPMIRAIVPKPGKEPPPRPHPYRCATEDLDGIIDELLDWASSHQFLGDAIPGYPITFAPDHFAALLGADITYHPDSTQTAWVGPFVTNWDDTEIRFRRDGHWWQRTVECIHRFRERCDGKLVVSGTQLQGGLDCLTALRGANELLMDLLDCPGKVKRALDAVDKALHEVRSELVKELNVAEFGSVTRHGLYSTGIVDVPQCDFSAMISPAMFKEFELPALKKEVRSLDAAEYHLDGPDAIKHLETICEVEEISAIQWQPGAGEAAEKDWTGLYRRIDALGKGHLRSATPEDIPSIWQACSSRQILFSTAVTSKDEMERLIENCIPKRLG